MSAVPPSSSAHDPTGKFGFPVYHAESRSQVRVWLEHLHDVESGVWLCSWRANTGRPRCPYPEVVEEALCFGWIDSTVGVLDEHRGLQLLTPRKAKSSWTRLNRQRVADMAVAGRMTDAGHRIIEIAKANGYWTIYDAVEDLIEPTNLAVALDANLAARMAWNAFPTSARKIMLWWVISAAKHDTQLQRIATIVTSAAIGERART